MKKKIYIYSINYFFIKIKIDFNKNSIMCIYFYDKLFFVDKAGKRSTIEAAALPPPLHMLPSFLFFGALTMADKLGIAVAHAPQPFNVFANFRVYPDGRFDLEECVTKPGDSATFKLLMDGIVVISACPQDIVGFQPGGPTDMAIEILDRPEGSSDE